MNKTTQSKVTLKDIAEDSGLSISTVSRALARTGKISAENEKKIFESAHRLNYPITHLNTPLELRQNLFVALVTSFHKGEFFSTFYDGFDVATKHTNANIALINVANASVSEIELIRELQRAKFDAAIVFLPDFHQEDYKALIENTDPNFPIISVAPIANPVMDTITFDTYRGGYLAADHFFKQGFRKLGIITGPSNKSEAMLRRNGFSDFISLTKELELVWQFEGDYDIGSGFEAYNAFKEATEKPTAIFCSNDSMAVGFMQNAMRDGLIFPKDVAIIGYDDLPVCKFHTPTITSVNTPYEKLGKKAIEYLVNRLSETSMIEHSGYVSLVPVSLSIRESSTNPDNKN